MAQGPRLSSNPTTSSFPTLRTRGPSFLPACLPICRAGLVQMSCLSKVFGTGPATGGAAKCLPPLVLVDFLFGGTISLLGCRLPCLAAIKSMLALSPCTCADPLGTWVALRTDQNPQRQTHQAPPSQAGPEPWKQAGSALWFCDCLLEEARPKFKFGTCRVRG